MSETLETLQTKLDGNTHLIEKLQTDADAKQGAIAAAFAALQTQIVDLKAQLDAGTLNQAALDALGASIDAQATALTAVDQDIGDTPVPAETPVPVVTPPVA